MIPTRTLFQWPPVLVVAAAVAVLASIAAPEPATAQCDDFPTSSIGTVINLGGYNGGSVDPLALKTVTIRDCFNNPVANATVVIDFDGCSQDVRPCEVQPHHPGPSCALITAVTNADGVATFRIAGAGLHFGSNAPGVGSGCARVTVGGQFLGQLTVGVPDQNGVGGIDVTDLSAFGSDRFGAYRGRSDFNGDGVITVADLGIFARFRFGGGSVSSCARTCQ